MKSRQTRSDEVLVNASKHLAYEIQMLDSLARQLQTWALGDGPLKNATLEAFTIHARSILDFFYLPEQNRPLHKDQVLADDYFHDDPSTWRSKRPERTPILNEVNNRVNREIAHLTYNRLEMLSIMNKWPALQIRDGLFMILGAFITLVPASRIDDELRTVSKINDQLSGPALMSISPGWTTGMT
jgi:hypothetical protein